MQKFVKTKEKDLNTGVVDLIICYTGFHDVGTGEVNFSIKNSSACHGNEEGYFTCVEEGDNCTDEVCTNEKAEDYCK